MQAEKALAALDRLTACLQGQPGWAEAVDASNVGFLGFSFGGATASEAGVMDERVRAVFNLDGWVFGQAFAAKLDKPYWLALDDRSEPTAAQLASSSEADRNYVDLTGRLIDAALALSDRYGGCAVKIAGARHESYIDAFFERRFAPAWLHLNPDRAKAIRDDLEVSFFDRLKPGRAPPGCDALLARWPELVRLKPVALTRDAEPDARALTRLRP
ncbi:MAG: hypothetical protein INR70_44105 [Parafilimonas terrae]|nr:hypothetical protein [Parafilimonas terrae]